MKYKIVIILSFILILAFTGCQPEEPSESTPTTIQSEPTITQLKPTNTQDETISKNTSYPITTPTSQVDQAYPYPGSEIPYGRDEGPKFTITKPIKDGDTIIEGSGPAGVPIILVDVTELGTLLGETIISNEGVFKFELDKPVQKGHTIGIQLGDISNTDINPADYQYSSTYYDRPQIGILFDIGNVE